MAINPQESQTTDQSTVSTKWSATQDALVEVRKAFGFVPEFVESLTEQSIPGAWSEAKNFFYNPNTALEMKIKDLMGLAVSCQIPCELSKYFNQRMCAADHVTKQEQSEATLMSAITRHWSTVLNGSQLDKKEFRKEADQIMSFVKNMMADLGGRMPPQDLFLVNFSSAQDAYQDMKKMFGLTPRFFQLFPEEAIPGAWSEFKAVQLNPYTSLHGKHKELIGLSVASQIPCDYCIYFHRSAAVLNGATDREITEAIAMGAMTRHWSTIFHAAYSDTSDFRRDADRMVRSPHSAAQTLHS